MRELQLLDDDGIDTVFADIAALASRCRFLDCRHDTEPGCAVKEAVESAELDADRFEHHRKLEREAKANELRHDEQKRRQAERVWGHSRQQGAARRREAPCEQHAAARWSRALPRARVPASARAPAGHRDHLGRASGIPNMAAIMARPARRA
jgi:hypothetical protein